MHLKEFQTIDTSVVGETMERIFGLQFDIQKGNVFDFIIQQEFGT